MKKKLTSLLIALSMLASTTAFADAIPEAASISTIGGADGPTQVYVSEPVPIEEMPSFDYSVFTHPAPEMPFSEDIAAQFEIEGTANVYYNSQYLDPAIIIGGRTMLPFRAFLESVGATVDYDDATRTASAVKKDTTVSFNLDSEIIHVTNEDGNKELTMDVKPVIIEGHSYVPIRFLSEAFGMQVGWSSYEQTAVIADIEAYLDELWANCPNLSKLAELGVTIPESSYSVSSADFGFNTEVGAIDYLVDENGNPKYSNSTDKIDLEFSLNTEGTTVGMDADSKSTVSVKYSDTEGNSFDLSDCTLDIIFKDNAYYIRTNILSQLEVKGIIEDIPELLLNSEAWYKLSLENYLTLLSNYSGAEFDMEAITELMNNATDPKAAVAYVFENMGEINSTIALDAITQMMGIYPVLDKYIAIESPNENAYDISFKLDTDTLIDLIGTYFKDNSEEIYGYELTDEEFNEYMEEFKQEFEGLVLDINVTSRIENGVTLSENAYINLSFEDGADKFKLYMDVNSTVDPKANVDDIGVPENVIDILGKIYGK